VLFVPYNNGKPEIKNLPQGIRYLISPAYIDSKHAVAFVVDLHKKEYSYFDSEHDIELEQSVKEVFLPLLEKDAYSHSSIGYSAQKDELSCILQAVENVTTLICEKPAPVGRIVDPERLQKKYAPIFAAFVQKHAK
jgi:hypothetical protein